MTDFYIIKGVIVGFLIAAPVGPMGILCVKRALLFGFLSGVFSGLGAATADTLFAAIAAFGVSAIASLIESQQKLMELVGGTLLLGFAAKNLLSSAPLKVEDPEKSTKPHSLLGHYFSSFFLTITNPITVIATGALFASFGVGGDGDPLYRTLMLIAGVFIGSATWFVGLSTVSGVLLHKKLTDTTMHYVHKIAGVIFLVFGIAILSYAFFGH